VSRGHSGWGSSPEHDSQRVDVNLKRGAYVEGLAKTKDGRTPHEHHAPECGLWQSINVPLVTFIHILLDLDAYP
jgi:hypothetical protein